MTDTPKDDLTPSPNGIHCTGNGQHELECQCDECDFFLDCFQEILNLADRGEKKYYSNGAVFGKGTVN